MGLADGAPEQVARDEDGGAHRRAADPARLARAAGTRGGGARGGRARVVTGRGLDVRLVAVLPPIAFFVVARLELTAGVGAGLLFGFAAALTVAGLAWLAGTRLLVDSEMGFQGFSTFGVSTGSWAPFWTVNGPVRGQINLNCSSGVLSPGTIANAAIGRAMGFIIKNLGGVRKGIEDMGVMGNPLKYTAVMAENEEESPWEPLHTEYGYRREDSTIMLTFPQSYVQHYPPSNDEDGIMRSVLDNIVPGFGYSIMFPPLHAKMLASFGWTKQDIRDFICEYKRVPATQRGRSIGQAAPKLFKGHVTAREGDTLPLIRDPRVIRGGRGAMRLKDRSSPRTATSRCSPLPGSWKTSRSSAISRACSRRAAV